MSGAKRFFLLADDDFEDQEMFAEAVASVLPEMSLQTVNNGLAALTLLQNCADDALPSLILLDYKMPVMGAIDVLERLKEDPLYLGIPKVVWSSSVQDDHKKSCFARGASEYFIKPNNMAELNEMVKLLSKLSEEFNR